MATNVLNSMAVEGAVHPTLAFQVELDYTQHQQAILNVDGWLSTRDGALAARLDEKPVQREGPVSARMSAYDSSLFQVKKFTIELLAQLDPVSLDRTDKERVKDPKHDLHLKLDLRMISVEASANIDHLFAVDLVAAVGREVRAQTSTGPKKADIGVLSFDQQFNVNPVNGWVLSGGGSPTYLKTRVTPISCNHRIPSQDWVSDYAPKLGLGRYAVLEIPSGGELFAECTTHLSKAEESFRRWETKDVFSNCHQVGRLLDDRIKKTFGESSFTYHERWGRGFNY